MICGVRKRDAIYLINRNRLCPPVAVMHLHALSVGEQSG